ncbi:lachrymatory-factor synthase-like [Dendrobium catenatum]|nr:lachrymatory-factor synthase-like [Dendrobium catenatum]
MPMESESKSKKWVGRTTACFPATTVVEAWAIAGNFCAAHKWLPLDTCCKIEGEENEPGCIRLCGSRLNWVKERLVTFDPVGHTYAYEITESNMGFGNYLSFVKLIPAGEEGCQVEWAFEADPVDGWTKDGLVSYMQTALEAMEKAILLNNGK